MASTKQSRVTDSMLVQLSETDKRVGLPAGTMYSIMMQETGGRYGTQDQHYPSGVAPNGKRSSASGPFGILTSTALNPGYGVAPLDKAAPGTEEERFAQHLRFAGDYAKAVGISKYGEGEKYAQQVNSRIAAGKGGSVPTRAVAPVGTQAVPEMVAEVSPAPVQDLAVPLPQAPQPILAQQIEQPQEDPWASMQQAMPRPVLPDSLAYGGQGNQQAVQPNFNRFTSFKGRA